MALPNNGKFFIAQLLCKGIKRVCSSFWDKLRISLINDVYIGTHEGYSTPFDVEPQGEDGENEIVLSVI